MRTKHASQLRLCFVDERIEEMEEDDSRGPGERLPGRQDLPRPAPSAPTEGETWNTCPDCWRKWKDTVPTPGVLHRTRLCAQCAELKKGLKW